MVFNPDIPENRDPTWYMKVPQPIKEFQYQSGEAIALKGIGDVIGGAIKTADTFQEATAENKARAGSRALQEEELSNLVQTGTTKQLMTAGFAGDQSHLTTSGLDSNNVYTATERGTSLLGQEEKPGLPVNLQSSLQTPAKLENARANGHITETGYWLRLNAFAKDLRSQYPGYTQVIDETIRRVTGKDPANAARESMVADINAAQTKDTHLQNAVETEMLKNAGRHPLIMAELQRWGQGDKNITRATSILYPILADDAKRTAELDRINLDAKRGEDVKKRSTESFNRFTVDKATELVQAISPFNGKTPAEIQAYVQQVRTGKMQLPPGFDLESLAQQVEAHRDAYVKSAWDEYRATDPYSKSISSTEAGSMIEASAYPLDNIVKAIRNKDMGLMTETQRRVQAVKDYGDWFTYLRDRGFGAQIATYESAKKVFGDVGMRTVFGNSMDPRIDQKALRVVLDDLTTQLTAPVADPRDKRTVFTASGAIDALKKYEKENGGIPANAYKEFFRQMTTAIPLLKGEDLNDAVYRMFNPANLGYIRQIYPDEVVQTPQGPRMQEGKESAYARLTHPEFATAVMKSKNAGMYVDWVRATFAQDISKDAIRRLDNIPIEDKWYRIEWMPKENQFQVINKEGIDVSRNFGLSGASARNFQRQRQEEAGIIVNGLNKGIKGLTDVAKAGGQTGDDISTFVLSTITAELQGRGEKLKDMQGIPAEMARRLGQIEVDRATQKKQEEEEKAKRQRLNP